MTTVEIPVASEKDGAVAQSGFADVNVTSTPGAGAGTTSPEVCRRMVIFGGISPALKLADASTMFSCTAVLTGVLSVAKSGFVAVTIAVPGLTPVTRAFAENSPGRIVTNADTAMMFSSLVVS